MSRTERVKSAERGDLTTILPWLVDYTEGAATRLPGPAPEETDPAKFERAASACRHQGGITVAARSLLAETRAPGNEATWTTVKAKFPGEDRNSVQAAAAAARAASVTESEEGSGPTWRPEGEFNPQVAFEVINSRNALSGAGSDGLRFSHLQSIIRTQFGQETSAPASKPSGGGWWMNLTLSRRSFRSSSCSQTSRPWEKNATRFVRR